MDNLNDSFHYGEGQLDVSQPPDLPVSPEHLSDLTKSGLTKDTIRDAGLRTVTDPAEISRILNWTNPTTALGACLAFPYPGVDGRPSDYTRLKPIRPRTKSGKAIKYESPRQSKNRAYILPGVERSLASNDKGIILITEGEKKTLAAIQAGYNCIGLVGVYGWQEKRSKDKFGKPIGDRRLIPDLSRIIWIGRCVFIVFDSDAASNSNVRHAEAALASALRKAGATVVVVRLPGAEDGNKLGLDDYLVKHGSDALRRLLDESATRA
jgi:hypothetical protein